MKTITLTRRRFLSSTALSLFGSQWIFAGSQASDDTPRTLRSLSRFSDSLWCFDPVGLHVEPGETIRFIGTRTGITTMTAYHPENENHELRIPEGAQPFDLGYPEEAFFDWRFETEGTYDYFSRFQEILGMVGRIVVGTPGGPGEKAWGYGSREGRNPIYKEILKTAELLNSQEIVRKKELPFPFDDMIPPYPLWD